MGGISGSQPAKGVCPSHLLGAVFAFMLFAKMFRSCRLMAHEPPEHISFFLVTKKRMYSFYLQRNYSRTEHGIPARNSRKCFSLTQGDSEISGMFYIAKG